MKYDVIITDNVLYLKELVESAAIDNLTVLDSLEVKLINGKPMYIQTLRESLGYMFVSSGQGTITQVGKVVTIQGTTGQIMGAYYNKPISTGKNAINFHIANYNITSKITFGFFIEQGLGGSNEAIAGTHPASTVLFLTHANAPIDGNKYNNANTNDIATNMDVAVILDSDTGVWGIVTANGTYIDDVGAIANASGSGGVIGNLPNNAIVYPFIQIEALGNTVNCTVTQLTSNIANVPVDYLPIQ